MSTFDFCRFVCPTFKLELLLSTFNFFLLLLLLFRLWKESWSSLRRLLWVLNSNIHDHEYYDEREYIKLSSHFLPQKKKKYENFFRRTAAAAQLSEMMRLLLFVDSFFLQIYFSAKMLPMWVGRALSCFWNFSHPLSTFIHSFCRLYSKMCSWKVNS